MLSMTVVPNCFDNSHRFFCFFFYFVFLCGISPHLVSIDDFYCPSRVLAETAKTRGGILEVPSC